MRRGVVAVLLAFALAGCARAPQAKAPPEIHYGEDHCTQCTMVVDDPRFACALATADGRVLVFDDIGDMFTWEAAHPAERPVAAWVHDYESLAWIEAATATYVSGTRIHTPMGHGIVALGARPMAERVAARDGGTVGTQTQARHATRGHLISPQSTQSSQS